MKTRIEIVALIAVVIAVVIAGRVWLEQHDDRLRLAATLQQQDVVIKRAAASQQARDKTLADQLAAIAHERQQVLTPAQIATAVSQAMRLPQPITITLPPTPAQPAAKGVEKPERTSGSLPAAPVPQTVSIPTLDLPALRAYTLGCQETDAKLTACESDLTDQKIQTRSMKVERDAALSAANGGTFWRRAGRAAKWTVLGIAIGVAAHAAIRH